VVDIFWNLTVWFSWQLANKSFMGYM